MIKVRQPLSRILIPVLDPAMKGHVQAVEELILTEVNVKKVEFIDDASGILVKKIKPNFRKLGKEHGPRMKEISALIGQFEQDDIAAFEKNGEYELSLLENKLMLTLEDVEIVSEDIPGWLVANDATLTVALDINITDDLRKEGIARDLVNRIQNIRKDLGLDVQDRVSITLESESDILKEAVETNNSYICAETQANNLTISVIEQGGTILDIDGLTANLKLKVEGK